MYIFKLIDFLNLIIFKKRCKQTPHQFSAENRIIEMNYLDYLVSIYSIIIDFFFIFKVTITSVYI